MTSSQKLQLRLSEIRQKLNELSGKDELTAEERAEMAKLTAEYPTVEERHRAAIVAESAEADERTETDTGDAEQRERLALVKKATLAEFLGAAVNGTEVRGAEAEVGAAYGTPGKVPLAMFDRPAERRRGDAEQRAVTTGGAGGTEQAAIVPAIFDRSAAAWLGITMPMAATGDASYPVISTSVAGGAGPKARSAAADETAGAFTVTTAQPRRVTGALRFRVEDAARLAGMEDALRMNLSAQLSDEIDNQAINGSGTGDGTINGLLAILTDPSAPADGAETFARYVTAAASHVDGLFAVDLGGVRQLVGPHTYRHMAGAFRANEDSMTAEAWLTDRTGGVRTSRRIADPASNIQQAIVRRANPAMDRVAVMPVWDGLTLIRDPYSDAGKGEVVVTALILCGDVVLLRPAAFVQDSYRLVA